MRWATLGMVKPSGRGGGQGTRQTCYPTGRSKYANRPRQAFGTSAVSVIGSFRTGCRNVSDRACRPIPGPSE